MDQPQMDQSTENSRLELEQRLLLAGDAHDNSNWRKLDSRSYVEESKITPADIPGLIEIMMIWDDEDKLDAWVESKADENFRELPIHAWRALGELRAEEAIEPLLRLAQTIADEDDDWGSDEIPIALSLIGEPAVPQIFAMLNDESVSPKAHALAMQSLTNIAMSNYAPCSAETRQQVADFFLDAIKKIAENPKIIEVIESKNYHELAALDFIQFNSEVLCGLLDLKVVEAAPYIEKAFSDNQFDCSIAGDWDEVQEDLGVPSLGLPMPEYPIGYLADFGLEDLDLDWSTKHDDEDDAEFLERYYARTLETFIASDEGEQVAQKFGEVYWTSIFFDYVRSDIGRTLDRFDVGHAEVVIFELFPQKVVVQPDKAAAIISELRFFWEFVFRVAGFSVARRIADMLDGEAAEDLYERLDDPQNYSLVKSMLMKGVDAGFEMTSREGLDQFMLAYNANPEGFMASRFDNQPHSNPPQPKMSIEEKKAFDKNRKKLLAKKLASKKKRR